MSRLNLLEKGKSYTFRSYFEMTYDVEDILEEFGVGFDVQEVSLPIAEVPIDVVESLRQTLIGYLKRVNLTSETARREILVAPILLNVAELSDSKLRIEYPLAVDDYLKGKLDYLFKGKQSLLVIEAKNADLARGFTQLAVELIALAKLEPDQRVLYGAVTVGDAWTFGQFDVEKKHITRDLSLYPVPNDLGKVMSILMGILTNSSSR